MVKLQERAKGVFDNLIANLIVAGGAGLISWYTANQAIVAGIHRYLAILIGVIVFAVLGFTLVPLRLGSQDYERENKT